MSAFADALDLKLAVSEWVDRRDISDIYPRFVQEAEAVMNRFLRTRENLTVGATLTFTSSFAPLPSDFQEVKTLWDATNMFPLSGASSKELLQGSTDLYSYAIDGINVYIDGLTSTRLLDYYAKLATLTASPTTSNWLLQRSPDLYLYAVCVQAAKWMKNSDLAAAAQELMDREKLELFRDNARAQYAGAQIRMRSPTP